MRKRDLVCVMANLGLKKKRLISSWVAGSLEHLHELSRYVYEMPICNCAPGQPFVGQSAFAHKGGMHVTR